MKIIQVVGARPNFMKVAPLHSAFQKFQDVQSIVVHTGQHTDPNMSNIFMKQLNLRQPDFYLGISGGSRQEMIEKIGFEFEKALKQIIPDLVIVVGDVNSTLACAQATVKMKIPLAHVEAGLRCFDTSMPEENNRIQTDRISDFLFTTEKAANENLRNENVPESKIYFVGNCMIDSLLQYISLAKVLDIKSKLKIDDSDYALMTMHRPANVDTKSGLVNILELCNAVSSHLKIVFPIHPRTKNKLIEFGMWNEINSLPELILTEPLGYIEFLSLMRQASVVLTDSGGIQEETTFLKIPCLTYRPSTERPVTIEVGTNELIDNFNTDQTLSCIDKIVTGQWKSSSIPELWDGNAAQRIAEILWKQLH